MDNTVEVWKDVPGYEGLYQVSDLGRVKTMHRNSNRILHQGLNQRGYKYTQLSNSGVKKYKTIHQLVALAFLENPENKPEVNHKNGNKTDNNLSNLEWITHKGNIEHMFNVLGRKMKKGAEVSNSISISQKSKDGILLKTFGSIREAARETNIDRASILRCINGKVKTAGGYCWQ